MGLVHRADFGSLKKRGKQMRYDITFENFMSWLETQVKKAENHRWTYTPNNLEQIYKANNLNVLSEIYSLAEYYNHHGQDSKTKLIMMFNHVKQKFINESNLLKVLSKANQNLHYGIVDTYHAISDYLFWSNDVQAYLYQNGRYSETKEELLIS